MVKEETKIPTLLNPNNENQGADFWREQAERYAADAAAVQKAHDQLMLDQEKLVAERTRHLSARLDTSLREHAADLEKMRQQTMIDTTKHNTALNELRLKHGDEIQKSKDDLQRLGTMVRQQVQEEHAREIAALKADHESQLKALADEPTELRKLRAKHAEEAAAHADMADRHQQELNELAEKLAHPAKKSKK
jgi:hypothetical protein